MAYATLAQLKASMQKTNADDDTILVRILDGATRKINRFCNRPNGFEASDRFTTRHYKGSGYTYQRIDECVEIGTVAVKDAISDDTYETWDNPTTVFAGDGDWYPGTGDPDEPDFNHLPYTLLFVDPNGDQSWFTGETYNMKRRGRLTRSTSLLARVPTVEVSARWGFSEDVPEDIREACIMQSARWYKRLQGAMADALASTDLGALLYVQQIDPDVAGILLDGAYRRLATGRR